MTLAEIKALVQQADAAWKKYSGKGGVNPCLAYSDSRVRANNAMINSWPAVVAMLEEAREVLLTGAGLSTAEGERCRAFLARIDGDLK